MVLSVVPMTSAFCGDAASAAPAPSTVANATVQNSLLFIELPPFVIVWPCSHGRLR